MRAATIDLYACLEERDIYVLRYDLTPARLVAVLGPLDLREVTQANLAAGFEGLDHPEAREKAWWGRQRHQVWRLLRGPYPGDQVQTARIHRS